MWVVSSCHGCGRMGVAVRIFDLPSMNYAGLEGVDGIEVIKGDITNVDTVRRAVDGVEAVIHLAAILPPASERDRAKTFAVNVDGTTHIVRALEQSRPPGDAGL